jgi:hypothetical protein
LAHLVQEVAKSGERVVLALAVLGCGGLLADENAAAGAAGDETFVAQEADGLVHGSWARD